MNPVEIKGALEAIIYAADEPATVDQMAVAIGIEKQELRPILDELVASYGADERGMEIREVAGGFKFYTKTQYHDAVRRFIKGLRPPLRLTMSALETLAVIAYKQPVTQPEMQEIRGVNSSGVLQTLLEKRLITTAGRKAVIGRPILYRTSREFLMRFGLSDVQDLPSLKEFEALARQALGADEGIAPIEPEDMAQAPGADNVGVSDATAGTVMGSPFSVEPSEPETTSSAGAALKATSDGGTEAIALTSDTDQADEPQARAAESGS